VNVILICYHCSHIFEFCTLFKDNSAKKCRNKRMLNWYEVGNVWIQQQRKKLGRSKVLTFGSNRQRNVEYTLVQELHISFNLQLQWILNFNYPACFGTIVQSPGGTSYVKTIQCFLSGGSHQNTILAPSLQNIKRTSQHIKIVGDNHEVLPAFFLQESHWNY
jgi:hypothetical protein